MGDGSQEKVVDTTHLALLTHVHGEEWKSRVLLGNSLLERFEIIIVVEAFGNTNELNNVPVLSRGLEMWRRFTPQLREKMHAALTEVASKVKSRDVREVVDQLKRDKRDLATLPSRVERPWGSYETKDRGSRFQIKHILVAPGETLSLQMHYHRSEHWVVVSGTAEVTVGDKIQLLQENQSTYVPAGATHRLENPGRIPLRLIEVQCGSLDGTSGEEGWS